jgi:hypothetical protein
MKTKMMIVLLLLCSLPIFAQNVGDEFSSGGINYRITSATEVEVARNPTTIAGVVSIPASVTDNSISYSVNGVGNFAFYDCNLITSVVMPNTVAQIKQLAFARCFGLISVDIPNSVVTIGKDAFKQCIALPSIKLPNSVTSLGISAFQSCLALTSIAIPNSITTISDGTFQGCTALTSVILHNAITTIGREAFQHCSDLTTFTIPASVTSIGDAAFEGCTNLRQITIPDSVTIIEPYTFQSCISLSSVTLPCTLTSISILAFNYCPSLTSIAIPSSVSNIGVFAFSNCTALVSVTANWATPISIMRDAFYNVNLSSLNLYVPVGTEAIYDAAAVWTEFGNINEPLTAIGSSITVCFGSTIADITPTGSGLNWFTSANGGVALPIETVIASGSYYVSRTSNCIESERMKLAINIISTPVPTARPQVLLTGATVANLVASGVDLRWYVAPTGGTRLSNTTNVTSNLYYVSQTVNNCESQRTAVSVTVVNQPQVSYCQNLPAVSLASPFAVGAVVRWYTNAIGGIANPIAPTPRTTTVGRLIFYVSQVINGVETNRIPYFVDTFGIPAAPGAITGATEQGALVGRTGLTALAAYTIAPVANATSYNWTVPAGVNIFAGQGTDRLVVNFSNVSAGAGTIGNLMVVAVNAQGCSTKLARTLTLTKALPAAPTAIRMTDAALAVPASGIATAVTNISRYIGQPTVLTLTATPVAGVTTYEWELPAGVTVLSGALPVRGGALGGNVITVNFEGVTTAGMFNFTTTSGILTHVLRIGVRSITGVGASVTSNTSLVNPTTNNTARLLTLTATAPRASSSIRMTDTMAVDPTKAITVMSTFIGTQKTLTLTATPVATANQYNWELPAGVKQLSGGNSNVITVNFADVAAGTTSLYLGVKAMNGAGGSVTSNTSLVPATNSTARLLRLSATVPGTVPAVDGQVVGLCGNETYTYSITPSLLATYYAITAPEGSIVTSKSKQSNKSNSLNTPDLDFTVSYPEKLMTTNEKPASITVAAINGVGMSKSLRTLIVTNSLHGPLKIIMSTDFDRKYIGAQVTHSNHRIKKRFNPNLQSRWTVNDGVEIVSGQGTDEIEIDYSKVLPTIKSTKVSVYVENSCGVVSLPITTTIILERTVDKTAETLTIEATEVYPNPVVSDLSIDVTASAIGSLTMTVFSLDGNLAMNSKTVALQEGNNTITENVSSLGKGVYILQLVNTSNNEIITKKLIKD